MTADTIALHNKKEDKNRLFEVDLLRFIAAVSVVLFHYTYNGPKAGNIPISYNEVSAITRYGYLGVNLFFIISGFVISLSANGRSTKQFITSRIVRLYPAFWLACTVTFLVTLLVPSTLTTPTFKQYVINMTMFHEFFSTPSIDGVYWTLTYELKFYLLIMLLISIKQFKNIQVLCILWLAFTLLIFSGIKIKYIGLILFPDYGPYFVAGILFYLIKQNSYISIQHGLLLAGSYILACVGVFVRDPDSSSEFKITAICIIALFFIIFTMISLDKFSEFRSKWATELGSITYPLYLIHAYMGYIAFQLLNKNLNIHLSKYLILILLIIFFLIVSYAFAKYIEKPVAKRLKLFIE